MKNKSRIVVGVDIGQKGDVLGDFVLRDWQIPEEGKKAKPRSQKESFE
jgi:hypothetical protein